MLKLLILVYLGAVYLGVNVAKTTNEEAIENPVLLEDDIMQRAGRQARSVDIFSRRWTNATIPYDIEAYGCERLHGFKLPQKKMIHQAMKHIENRTCIRFRPRKITDENYLQFTQRRGCFSFLGMIGGKQAMNLANGCFRSLSIIIHELNHAIGLNHEHNRPDRDEYLKIFLENVEPWQKQQFDKRTPEQEWMDYPFDYDSVMLYGEDVFAKGPNLKTMVAREPGIVLKDAEYKPGLSKTDIIRINFLYDCKHLTPK